jgi:flagellar biosynthesis protein FlhA
MEPNMVQNIMDSITQKLEKSSSLGYQIVVLCSAAVRSHFKRLVEGFIPGLTVLSYNEILNNIDIQSLGTVGLSNAN